MIFDENTLGINLLNSSSSLLNNDPFDIIEEPRLIVTLFGVSMN